MVLYIYDAGLRSVTPPESWFKPTELSAIDAVKKVSRVESDQAQAALYEENQQGEPRYSAETDEPVYARDIMSSPVTTIEPGMPIKDAWALISVANYHHLPVVQNDQLLGIISDRDILKSQSLLDTHAVTPKTVADIMTTRVYTATEDTVVRVLADLMCQHRFAATPIISEQGRVIGIVSKSDILKILINHASIELWG